MAVPCPGCGRGYDATLFQFGRTIHCTCGTRVGLAATLRVPARGTVPRFAADRMLGRLARWLRLVGVDCAYDPDAPAAELVRRAVLESRQLLTRDRGLRDAWRVEAIRLVEADRPTAQLEEVVRRFGLARSLRPLSRCGVCNTPLEPAAPGEVAGRVPPRVLEAHTRFSTCPACRRIYWAGTHARRIRELAARLARDG